MKPTLYMESTIPSYLVSRSSRDVVIAGHQQLTRDWWETRRNRFDIFVSQLVIDEISAGDATASSARMEIVRALRMLEITKEVNTLSVRLLASGIIPRRAAVDAAHIALSAVHSIDFLLTWNCTHIANAEIAKRIAEICSKHGFDCPIICTPQELMGDQS